MTSQVLGECVIIGSLHARTVRQAEPQLEPRTHAADAWMAQGTPVPVADDGTFTDSFAVTMNRDYRFTASADGLRQEASSASFKITETRVTRVLLDSTTTVVFPDGATERTLVIALPQGQDFTVHGDAWPRLTPTVLDPAGAVVAVGQSYRSVTTRAATAGDYTIRLTGEGPSNGRHAYAVTISSPVVTQTTPGGPWPRPAGRPSWPGRRPAFRRPGR